MKKTARLLFAAILLAAIPAVAMAASHTQAQIYRPFNSSGKPVGHVIKSIKGHCWTGSLSTNRSNAWRCLSGNLIYDPCFSSPQARRVVLCPATGPWSSGLIKIKLTKQLPRKYANKGKPSTHGLPWALVTTKGWKCRLDTGATAVVDGQRENYFCSGTKRALWGSPDRHSEPWTIYVAGSQAKHLHRKTGIKAAWF